MNDPVVSAVKVRGSTVEERQLARRKLAAERRALFFRNRLLAASSSYEQLGHACAYVRAMGDDLAEAEVARLAREIAELADRWSRK